MKKTMHAGCLSMLLALGLTGCDQGSSHYELTIEPEEEELTFNGDTVRLTVTEGLRDLSEPLEWEVSNASLGAIVAHEGVSAVYKRHRSGVNIVTVRDQYGAEGIATMTSPASETGGGSGGYSLVLVANPSEVIPVGVETVTITAINGEAPYAWSVGDATKGAVSAGSGDTITYTSSDTGDNTVICVDKNGARGTITITQE